MRIESVSREISHDNGVALKSLVARHTPNRPPIDFYYKFFGLSEDSIDNSPDPFAAACLIKSMRANEPLVIDPPISRRLHVMLPRIRDIYHSWWPTLFKRIDIRSTPRVEPDPLPKNAIGTFFSGGVDSFYSLLKHHQESAATGRPLTHIVFMRGVETPIELTKGVEDSEAWVSAVGESLGVKPVFGITNVRTHIMTNWEKYDHGSALASIALCLSPLLGYMCIPSAFSYRHLVAHGSSPLTDEMFSSDRMYMFHDGSEVTRAQKVEAIVKWNKELSLKYLRVCLGNFGGAYNCGRCRKCVRTAIPLHVLGVLEDIPTFKYKQTDHWGAVVAKDHLELLRENLEFAQRRKADPAVLGMLNQAIRKWRFDNAVEELRLLALEDPAVAEKTPPAGKAPAPA